MKPELIKELTEHTLYKGSIIESAHAMNCVSRKLLNRQIHMLTICDDQTPDEVTWIAAMQKQANALPLDR